MGALGGMLGLNGGVNGTGIAGPASAPITPGATAAQIANGYTGTQGALGSQQALLAALQGQNGLANQSQNYNQLQGVINGTGPNPAQAMLNQQTGQNVANQAALMAGQRGAGANVGLMARQIAQQGAQTQQQAIGQGATLQAQQSLGALGQAGQMANNQAGQQVAQTNANTNAQLAQSGLLQQALANQNQQGVAMQSNVNDANANMYGGAQKAQSGLLGGVLGGIGGGLSTFSGGLGGVGKGLAGAMGKGLAGAMGAEGGEVMGPKSSMGQFLHKAMGGNVGSQLQSGGSVPGKAKVAGNSYSNDTVKALLSPGEVVIPRNVMQSQNPADGAARFVQAVLAKKGKK